MFCPAQVQKFILPPILATQHEVALRFRESQGLPSSPTTSPTGGIARLPLI